MSILPQLPYDLILFGASGYTGKLAAEYIAICVRTDLKWAIAGRSRPKLENLAYELKNLNSDRIQPGPYFGLQRHT